MRLILVTVTLLSIVGIAYPQCTTRSRVCATPVVITNKVAAVVTPVVVTKTIVAEVVPVAVYQPLAVAVPVYGGAYQPPYPYPYPPQPLPAQQQTPNGGMSGGDVKAILDALQSLDRRLKSLETGVTPVAPQLSKDDPFAPKAGGTSALESPKDHPALAVLQAKCASCHESKVSGEKGGGFTLFNGLALARLDDRQARRIATKTFNGTMPPKDSKITLTDAEAGQIQAFVDSLK